MESPFTIVSNWYQIATLLNIRNCDGTYVVTGRMIRQMFDNLPNIDPGLELSYNNMICRWRKDFWIPLEARNERGYITGGGIKKFLTSEEEKGLIELIQIQIFDKSRKLSNIALTDMVKMFLGMTEDHPHALKDWSECWLNRFVLRHQGKGRRSLKFTVPMQQTFPEAILNEHGHNVIKDLERLLKFRIFQPDGEDTSTIIGSEENKTRYDNEILERKRKSSQKPPKDGEVPKKRRKSKNFSNALKTVGVEQSLQTVERSPSASLVTLLSPVVNCEEFEDLELSNIQESIRSPDWSIVEEDKSRTNNNSVAAFMEDFMMNDGSVDWN
jgi:hypothetical protein